MVVKDNDVNVFAIHFYWGNSNDTIKDIEYFIKYSNYSPTSDDGTQEILNSEINPFNYAIFEDYEYYLNNLN